MKRGGGDQGGRAGKAGSHRKGAPKGSGGQRRRGLEGRGPTPPAEERKGHPAARRAATAKHTGPRQSAKTRRPDEETVVGRNAVVEALRAGVPANYLLVAIGQDPDARVAEAVKLANAQQVPYREVDKRELDRAAGGAPHQGLALAVAPFEYAHPDDVLARATDAPAAALIVALDGVTDPRNLGAVIRSAAAFGAHGVVVPERRAATMTAGAWKASAGTAATLPVARATNLVRTLKAYSDAGLLVVGLDGDGETSLDDLELAADPLVLVVGSEGRGLSRLVGERCDLRVRIPIAGRADSLNASVAAGVALAEIARRRRAGVTPG